MRRQGGRKEREEQNINIQSRHKASFIVRRSDGEEGKDGEDNFNKHCKKERLICVISTLRQAPAGKQAARRIFCLIRLHYSISAPQKTGAFSQAALVKLHKKRALPFSMQGYRRAVFPQNPPFPSFFSVFHPWTGPFCPVVSPGRFFTGFNRFSTAPAAFTKTFLPYTR